MLESLLTFGLESIILVGKIFFGLFLLWVGLCVLGTFIGIILAGVDKVTGN